jgi:hypothetical protein
MLDLGHRRYRCALELLARCQARNAWPGYQPNGRIETISLPRYAVLAESAARAY